jgi:hypothetical protein
MTAIPAGFGRASIRFGVTGDARQPAVTFGFTDDGATAPNVIAAGLSDNFYTNFVPAALANTYSIQGCDVEINRGGGMLTGNDPTVRAGTAAFNALPLACAFLLRKGTGVGGRKNHGRMYLPAGYLGELSVDQAGIVDPAVVAATTPRGASFLAQLVTDNWDMVLLHAAGGAPTPVTTLVAQPMIATQRRRQRKR